MLEDAYPRYLDLVTPLPHTAARLQSEAIIKALSKVSSYNNPYLSLNSQDIN